MDIARIRQEYAHASLNEADAAPDPFMQFGKWFQEAVLAKVPLPNAMTLATVGADGAPAARIVLLKGMENGGFSFFTNYDSRKGRELGADARAALVFLWSDLERQVRVEGTTVKLDAAESDAYFATRPLGARLGAWASPQSRVLPDRAALEARLAEATQRHGEQPRRPSHWGGYKLVPSAVEFWQGRSDRLHDRLRYRLSGERWLMERLAP
jgi:pyridoxamine 5'-phosphate oxidase